MGLALCGVLAGCSSSTTITVQAGTRSFNGTTEAAAKFPISRSGWYHYELTFARVPPQAGAQLQVCLPTTSFQLIDEKGGATLVTAPSNATGEVSGSIHLIAGTWTGMSEGSIDVGGPGLGPPNPPGTFSALACPWSLTLTTAN
jgi:hypothetical protein